MVQIDINCDMGESIDEAGIRQDINLLEYISSANIACGFHAGDENTMRTIVRHAIKAGVAIGAHPSFDDKKNFGRKEITLPATTIYDLLATQLAIIEKIINSEGGKLHHVKPHGALYNMAAVDLMMAEAIVKAIADFDSSVILYGLAGSELITAGENMGLKVAGEAFADRRYELNGKLSARSKPGSVITNVDEMLKQVMQLLTSGTVLSMDNETVSVNAGTICIHGDGPQALQFAKQIHNKLRSVKIKIQALSNE